MESVIDNYRDNIMARIRSEFSPNLRPFFERILERRAEQLSTNIESPAMSFQSQNDNQRVAASSALGSLVQTKPVKKSTIDTNVSSFVYISSLS